MRLIPLTKGQFAQVDDENYEWLSQWKSHARWNPDTKSFYAVRTKCFPRVAGKQPKQVILMHRLLLGLEHGDPRKGDHRRPSETLNNQISNLRIAETDSESNANQRTRADSTSGYKGVRKRGNRYQSRIKINGKEKYLGTRDTREEAHALYVAAAQEQFGEFARAA